ncbi:UDP-N-acetylmuramoyl-tripeptide--D-alanyl-D-alanine ligase [Stutzerimonas xanthomarina]|uniref:UDP-N-acetylmuramoyl-tripeptide--D-alanyl-D-alanine ligase n=2 Tax=Stutzerimonas xanthomarina TaxID=271420 RepID=A0A1M5K249_9GAMM|nr:UDP-N-acetylmuramoyl-tripeptide--D-alanyl-D-alanine ligase [Stutzerimonas xanthomarina]MCP9339731.1 UDP-N-acetylmuramoyl-tripeptide--D-alanyl-D-alanine ligase [Stutzerimonas xanthomarina]SEI03827.1 UDP-N-acetylmuramoyl-tripeptide--D-alanyl-D-alanine ligase [Stutzerimonas xanthomarina]SHG46403.1 UDP-N-acetylmuramoyl-tripeptide--D-alanyl-D-alanine ligase [Stutzerimonas xanthomarina DSM 18231]
MLEAKRLSDLLEPLSATLINADAAFGSVSTDSRAIEPGQLFIALTGPRFDGHAYLAEVAAKGAVAALVERHVPEVSLPQLVVADSRIALGRLGALNRNAFNGPVAAITGSSGKTSVKELLASILRAAYGNDAVLATRGNLNNDLGAPLTLLELAPQHKAAVIELGASRVGEIAYTVSLTRPDVSLITNAGTAHVGEFGGPEKIVEAKGEILDGLGTNGVAVLNRDDRAYSVWERRVAGKRVVSFAITSPLADFHPASVAYDLRGCPNFVLTGPTGSVRVQLNLLGRHSVANALAAAAAASAMGVAREHIVAGLESLQPVKGRGVAQMLTNGVRLIDDTYNANPASICAAIDVLAGFAGRTVLVLGDMGELGSWAEQGHREVGSYAVGKVDTLFAVGPLMKHAVEAFGHGARHFADQQSLIESLRLEQGNATTILIKGSRSAAMDNVVAALSASGMEKH